MPGFPLWQQGLPGVWESVKIDNWKEPASERSPSSSWMTFRNPLPLSLLLPFSSRCHCWLGRSGSVGKLESQTERRASCISTSSIVYLTLGNHYLPLTSVLSSVREKGSSKHWQGPQAGDTPLRTVGPVNASGHSLLGAQRGFKPFSRWPLRIRR